MLCICCIGMVSATMQGEWLSGYFLGVVTAPTYFATPENRWADLLFEHIPSWAIVASRPAAMGFYESLPKGIPLPWEPWLPPMFWWGGFFAKGIQGRSGHFVSVQGVQQGLLVYQFCAGAIDDAYPGLHLRESVTVQEVACLICQ